MASLHFCIWAGSAWRGRASLMECQAAGPGEPFPRFTTTRCLLQLFQQKPQSLRHSAANKKTQRKTRRSLLKKKTQLVGSVLFVQNACGNKSQNSYRKSFTQACLTAEGFVVLVDFLRSFGKGLATLSVREKVRKNTSGEIEILKENPMWWCSWSTL